MWGLGRISMIIWGSGRATRFQRKQDLRMRLRSKIFVILERDLRPPLGGQRATRGTVPVPFVRESILRAPETLSRLSPLCRATAAHERRGGRRQVVQGCHVLSGEVVRLRRRRLRQQHTECSSLTQRPVSLPYVRNSRVHHERAPAVVNTGRPGSIPSGRFTLRPAMVSRPPFCPALSWLLRLLFHFAPLRAPRIRNLEYWRLISVVPSDRT